MRRTLAGRMVLTTVVVATVAVVVAGVVSFGLVRAATLNDARAAASAIADEWAALPQNELRHRVAERPPVAGEPKIALVESDGTVLGSSGIALRPKVRARVATGSKLSATISIDGAPYIVEAKPAAGGDTVVVARSIRSVDSQVFALAGKLLLALTIGLAVAIGAGILLGRMIAGPLVRTAAAARRLARGERGVDLPSSGTAEVSDVVEALEELDGALGASEARQHEFLLSISHELRTPLTAIAGYAEALVDGLIGPEEIGGADGVGATMLAETRRLDRFVADLLELARLEAHDFPVEPGVVDVSKLVTEAVTAWRAVAEAADVTLSARTAPGLLGETDAHRARQIIDGLLENALRVTPGGGAVTVTTRAGAADVVDAADRHSPGTVLITVSDTGPGLSASDREVAFERGVLHDRYRGARPVGTGLGLSIAQRLAARLGARLEAADTPQGAAFLLALPAARADERRVEQAPGRAGS
ncbi:HAMP domain-containing sensor histidine kinase [Microbacterium capsulatum]|uniref:histidine kinase n=1 Tax=Microbacterium capsulatum TaxID=3041921 RepID=A0ABU0XG00_9MICO|nr:HAMP domain-containing sensor histidine kinase [Microbacterium sp. ASV81]MDQ4213619.1 HAMP domain-containing sensor histidine kinase [Microbacterium sp. ASV81]